MLNILLVEDNEGDIELTERAFHDQPAYALRIVNDGMAALDLLHKRAEFADAVTPQLILLDLNMPRMDGKKFLEIIKADSRLKAIPVIMLTSSESPVDIRECYERYASCYVVKPFDCNKFAEVVLQTVHFWEHSGRLPS